MWEDSAVTLLRIVMNDMYSPFTYSDDHLEEVLIYAANFVNEEVSLATSYTVNVQKFSISPDPIGVSADGKLFINLMVLKAASILFLGEAKIASAQSIRIVDGPSMVDSTGLYKAKQDLYDKISKDYELAKVRAMLGDFNTGLAILTPYTQETVSSRNSLRNNINL